MPPETNPTPQQIIALVGLSGAGKSSVGRELAARLNWAFIDTDALIVQAATRPITRIFAEDGEAAFRELEHAALRQALTHPYSIVATGGGAILRPDNRSLLRQLAFVVWLDAPTTTLVDRLRSHHEERPLLATGDPVSRLDELRAVRAPLYEETAHLTIATASLSHVQIATYVLQHRSHT